MQAESVLHDMIESFVNEYNSGRKIENERYDELISLYAVTLARTESEVTALLTTSLDMTSLFSSIRRKIEDSVSKADAKAESTAHYVTEDAENEINRRFDALRSEKMSAMISAGMFNNTVWAMVEAGIERQRSEALVNARATSGQAVSNLYVSLAQVKGSVLQPLLAARQNISDAIDRRKITATEIRNNVVKWLADFSSSREELYPRLESVAEVAQQLGFSVGAAGNVL